MRFHSRREKLLWTAAAVYALLIYSTLGLVRTVTTFLRDRNLLRLSIGLVFALAAAGVVGWMMRRRARWQEWAALAGIAVAYAAIFPFAVAPEERIHLLQYGALAVLLFLALAERPLSLPRRATFAVLLTTLAGLVDEILQGLHPARYWDIRDVAFNALAGAIAVAALVVMERAGEKGQLTS
ncbi:MAG TPA: VanZ family protein [Thermoanaerobaculia bacterium]|nr:VanZ family protein [Thermoanaerobaculia bacterium]